VYGGTEEGAGTVLKQVASDKSALKKIKISDEI
jgi:hypothetical protein